MFFGKRYLIVAVFICLLADYSSLLAKSWNADFASYEVGKSDEIPADWVLKGTKWGVDATKFFVRKDKSSKQNVLVVDAKSSTATIIYDLSEKVDLAKTPIMRWTWRAKSLPKGADGRKKSKDDQALAIYIGSGGMFSQKSVAYRWETETPKGFASTTSYGGGLVSVKWFCINNKTDKLNKWFTNERNVADDFKQAYGYIPKKLAITIAGNSQYTESHSVGELLEIEFVEAPAEQK